MVYRDAACPVKVLIGNVRMFCIIDIFFVMHKFSETYASFQTFFFDHVRKHILNVLRLFDMFDIEFRTCLVAGTAVYCTETEEPFHE